MKAIRTISACIAVLLVASIANAAPLDKSIPFVDSGPFDHVDGSGPQRDAMNLLIQSRASNTTANANAPASRDVGDVAVIVDDGTLIIQPRPANNYDIPAGTTINFTPGAGAFDVSSSAGGIAADPGGVSLPLTDDSATAVEGVDSGTFAGFPFFGVTYSTTGIFVGSDGHVTFGAADGSSNPRDAARHIGGPPRVSALLVDLDVDTAGDIRAEVNATSLVITWDGVPQFGIGDSNSVQVILHSDGAIALNYGAVGSTVGVVGVAEGGAAGPFSEIDMTVDAGTFPAGAIFEEFGPAITTPQMNTLGVAQKFLETHPDEFDFIVVFTDFIVDIGGGAFAFHQGVKNETNGLGLRGTFDASASIGSAGEAESVLNMNRIGLYWPDARKMVNPPIKKFRFAGGASANGPPGSAQLTRRARRMGTLNGDFGFNGSYTLGLNSAMSIMGQEAGHRWLSFTVFNHPTKGVNFIDNFDLLGRSQAHWSFFTNVTVPPSQFGGDTRASSAEGNAILDLGAAASGGLPAPCSAAGESTFLTEPNELIDGFTELDQYFMGVREAADVSPFWYVDEPRSAFSGNPIGPEAGPAGDISSFAAQDDVVFCGKRVDLTVADITALAPFGASFGPRMPVLGDENDAAGNPACGAGPVDVKTMAFVVLVPADSSKHTSGISQVDTFRATWQEYANGPATAGRGRFDTSLNPVCH